MPNRDWTKLPVIRTHGIENGTRFDILIEYKDPEGNVIGSSGLLYLDPDNPITGSEAWKYGLDNPPNEESWYDGH